MSEGETRFDRTGDDNSTIHVVDANSVRLPASSHVDVRVEKIFLLDIQMDSVQSHTEPDGDADTGYNIQRRDSGRSQRQFLLDNVSARLQLQAV